MTDGFGYENLPQNLWNIYLAVANYT